jgi:hypothetical protein
MSDDVHAAEIAIVRAQRDALAQVVAGVRTLSLDAMDVDGVQIEALRVKAGLLYEAMATEAEAERFECQIGDPVMRLSEFGKAALAATRSSSTPNKLFVT